MMDMVFSYCSWLENDIGSNIIDFVNQHKHSPIPKYKVDMFLQDYHIDYFNLPNYLKEKIDELDVY